MEVEEIKSLIEVFERTTLTELELHRGESRLILKRESVRGSLFQPITAVLQPQPTQTAPSPTQQTAAQAKGAPIQEKRMPANGYVIEAPIVGTFFRRPAPGEEPYVEVGDRINPGDTVCLVEAMKVMNEVRTERAGIVKEIIVQDGKPVEYGQPLIVLELFEG